MHAMLISMLLHGVCSAVDTPIIISATQHLALQQEPEDPETGRYDWGASVMRDGDLYKMWWVRWGGADEQWFPYVGILPDGEEYAFGYPDRGDRIYYAESRDGASWNIEGEDYAGPKEAFGPDAQGPLMVLGPAETKWERMHVGTPCVIKVDGVYYMYYEAAAEFDVYRDASGAPTVGGEYHNHVFLARSNDGRHWTKHPNNQDPRPLFPTPSENKRPGARRYGWGQPCVYYHQGRYVMHFVQSEGCPLDFIIRLEADNPLFENAVRFPGRLRPEHPDACIPEGAVARFAQTVVRPLLGLDLLLRPAYGTGRLGVLATRDGLFPMDANLEMPGEVWPQIEITDPRGQHYRERLFPDVLTDPHGHVLPETHDGMEHLVIYLGSGRGWKEQAYTWDLHRCLLPLPDLLDALARAHPTADPR